MLHSPFSAARKKWESLSSNVRGALWVLAAALFLSAMAATLKVAGQVMSVWEMLLIRSIIALILLMPALSSTRFLAVRTTRPLKHLVRGLMGTCAFSLFFLSVKHIDLTLVVTLGFTRNLFVVVLAAIFLEEVIRVRRTIATLLGFVGVLVCIQPSPATFDPWSLAAIGFAMMAAGVTVIVKRLTETESPLTIIFYTYVYMGLTALLPALWDWSTPTSHELFLISLVAVFSTLGQTCMVHGLRAGEATAVTPFEYSRILYAFGFGFLLFDETPEVSTWIGGAVIVVSTLYIAYRNRVN